MPDIAQMTSELRAVPDQALQSELTNPTGLVPSYLVLAEAQRRQLMRQAAQKQQPQSGTVMQDVLRNMQAPQAPQGGPPPPAGMTPPKQGQGMPMPGAAPPAQMGMRKGGPIRLAEGGDTDDDTGDDTYVPPSQGGASRAADDVDGWIQKYSTKYNVDPDLAHAVMQWESGRQGQGARSSKGAIGRFQLEPPTAKDMGVDPNDPEGNVHGGIKYLGSLLTKYNRNEQLALAAYNAGPGTVDRYGGMPPYDETMKYVPGVLALRDRLKGQQRSGPLTQEQVQAGRMQMNPPTVLPPFPQGTPLTDEEKAAEAAQTTGADRAAPDDNEGAELPRPTAFMTNLQPEQQQAPVRSSVVAPAPQPFNPFTKENIASTRDLYNTLLGPDEMATTRAATIRQLQQLQQEAINRYHNPSPWEFLANMGAGMANSKQLSMPLALGAGVGAAWRAQDEQQQRDFEQAHALGQQLDTITNAAETERQRQGQQMLGMLTQQGKTPPGQTQEFEKFVGKGPYGQMDPSQAPGPGYVGIPDPNRPGWGVWVPQDQTAAEPKPTGSFEKDYLPGWAEEHGYADLTKLPAPMRKQALADFKSDQNAQNDPHFVEAANEIAQGIMDGTQPPDMKGLYRYGGKVRAILTEKGYNLTTAMRDWQDLQKFYAGLNGQTQLRLRQATEFVSQTIPTVRKLYQDWMTTGLPTGYKEFNKAALLAATNLPGDAGTKAQLLLTQLNDLTSEVGTMYKGGNNSTDESLRLAGENLRADWNPKTFMAAVDQLENNVKIRRNSMSSIGPVGVTPGSPYAAGLPTGGGATTEQPPLPKGIPPGVPAQYNAAKKQWRYKPQGSDEWKIWAPPQ